MCPVPLNPEQLQASYLAALDSTQHIVETIADDAWSRPTPCDEWDVRDVVNHLVYENLWAVDLFNGKKIEEVGEAHEGDLLGDQPIERYVETTGAIRAVIEQPDSMQRICHISSGPVPGSEYASQLFLDTLIHGWDIAVGSGQRGDLPPDLVETCMPLAEALRSMIGDSGPFASALQHDDDANRQDVLLAILGRDAGEWRI